MSDKDLHRLTGIHNKTKTVCYDKNSEMETSLNNGIKNIVENKIYSWIKYNVEKKYSELGMKNQEC